MPITYRFIEPLDVLFLRGNKLFGDPGSHGESLVPPWPSAAAGALRSLMLAHDGVDLNAFARGAVVHAAMGTPAEPGSFALTGFDLARRDAQGRIETLHALPADLIAGATDDGGLRLSRVRPATPTEGMTSSAPLPQWPVLAQAARGKPAAGRWLTQAGWAAYLRGEVPRADQLVEAAQLWQLDARVGVGLDATTRRAADGKLFSMQAVAFRPGVGFLAAVRGAELPAAGTVRFGGDGRGAVLHATLHEASQPDWEAIARARRCRVVLTTPGLFAQGWLLPGVDADRRWSLQGVGARLVCAAVPGAEVVSGWDLALGAPKAAQRAAPAGSVYWLSELEASADQLRKLAAQGLWDEANHNPSRRAEGFNHFTFASY